MGNLGVKDGRRGRKREGRRGGRKERRKRKGEVEVEKGGLMGGKTHGIRAVVGDRAVGVCWVDYPMISCAKRRVLVLV